MQHLSSIVQSARHPHLLRVPEHGIILASSPTHTMVLRHGKLYATGYNDHGQLGLGPLQSLSSIEGRWAEVPFTGDVSWMRMGSATSFLCTGDGILYSCGSNAYGQIGLGMDCIDVQWSFTRVPLPTTCRVADVSPHHSHSAMISRDGEVYTTGSPHESALGRPYGERREIHKRYQPVVDVSGKATECRVFSYGTAVLERGGVFCLSGNYDSWVTSGDGSMCMVPVDLSAACVVRNLAYGDTVVALAEEGYPCVSPAYFGTGSSLPYMLRLDRPVVAAASYTSQDASFGIFVTEAGGIFYLDKHRMHNPALYPLTIGSGKQARYLGPVDDIVDPGSEAVGVFFRVGAKWYLFGDPPPGVHVERWLEYPPLCRVDWMSTLQGITMLEAQGTSSLL